MDPQTSDLKFWTAIGAAAAGAFGAAKWWYHVRRMENADKVDGSVSTSIKYVIDELKAEIARAKAEHAELRTRIAALEAQNEEQHAEIAGLRIASQLNGERQGAHEAVDAAFKTVGAQ